MRRLSLIFAVLFVVPLFGSGSPKDYDDMSMVGLLEGNWRLTEVEIPGEKLGKLSVHPIMTFRGRTYSINYSERGNCCIDAARKPPSHIDFMHSNGPAKGQTTKHIFQIEGDTLRIAQIGDAANEPRPQGFNDKGVQIFIYERVK